MCLEINTSVNNNAGIKNAPNIKSSDRFDLNFNNFPKLPFYYCVM